MMQFENFDVNSKDEAFNKPNMQLVFDGNVDTVTILVQNKNGKTNTVSYHLSEDGKNWEKAENKSFEKISDKEIAESYFNGCYIDSNNKTGFDENLIRSMSLRHHIPVSEIKAAISSYRFKLTNRKPAKKDLERD